MPNARELQRTLNDFQQLVPAIVGAILAVVTAIGVLVAAVKEETPNPTTSPAPSTSQPAQKPKEPTPGNTGGNYSKPEFPDARYLHTHRGVKYDVQSGVDVTFNKKDYPKSIIATSGSGSSVAYYTVPEGYTSLTFDAAWASNIPNDDAIGIIEVKLNGGLRDRVTVVPGESKTRTVDVRGGGEIRIELSAVDKLDDKKRKAPNGLALLTPTLK